MAIRKGKDHPEQEVSIDPAVAVHLQNAAQISIDHRRQKETSLSAYQRRKRNFDRNRVKDTYDLTDWVKTRIMEIAAEEDVPKSHLADFLLAFAIQQYDTGKCDIRSHKDISRHPAFRYSLLLPNSGLKDKTSGWGEE